MDDRTLKALLDEALDEHEQQAAHVSINATQPAVDVADPDASAEELLEVAVDAMEVAVEAHEELKDDADNGGFQ